ncbi:MAG: SRPBCC domain-containing protein [Pseudonocardia sp.]
MGPRMEKRVELDADPEQVWEAIATGPGISAWFVPTSVEPSEGGAVVQSFGGGMDVTGTVLAHEPGRRFAYGAAEPPAEGANYAFEFLVEGRDGGGTVLRFVQSGFLDEGWEDEYRAFDTGWDLFFGNLASCLAHFAGRQATTVVAMAFVATGTDAARRVLDRALGLAGPPAVGERVTLTAEGLDPVTGTVDVATTEFLGVRTADALYRFGAEGGDAGCGVSAYHYLFGADRDDAAEKSLTAAWQAWLDGLFPAAS